MMVRHSHRAALLLLVLTVACGRADSEALPRDGSFGPPGSIEPGDDWVAGYSADSAFVFRVPPHYVRPIREYPCRLTLNFSGSEWVCVARSGRRVSLRALESPKHVTDAWFLTAFRTDTVRYVGDLMEVERARFTGGIGGSTNVRRMLVRVPLNNDEWVVVFGAVETDAGYDDVLAVARSLHANE